MIEQKVGGFQREDRQCNGAVLGIVQSEAARFRPGQGEEINYRAGDSPGNLPRSRGVFFRDQDGDVRACGETCLGNEHKGNARPAKCVRDCLFDIVGFGHVESHSD